MRKIRMLNEFKDMSDNNIKTRARMIARSLGKQLCEYEKNEIKRQNFQHNLETVKQQNTTQTSNTTKNSGNTTTSTNTTTGGKSKTGEKTKTSRKDEANGKSEANGKDAKIKDS